MPDRLCFSPARVIWSFCGICLFQVKIKPKTNFACGIGEALPLWAGYLIVAVVLLIIVAVLAVVGKKKVDAGLADTPSPQEGLRQNVEIAKEALASGLEKGNQK